MCTCVCGRACSCACIWSTISKNEGEEASWPFVRRAGCDGGSPKGVFPLCGVLETARWNHHGDRRPHTFIPRDISPWSSAAAPSSLSRRKLRLHFRSFIPASKIVPVLRPFATFASFQPSFWLICQKPSPFPNLRIHEFLHIRPITSVHEYRCKFNRFSSSFILTRRSVFVFFFFLLLLRRFFSSFFFFFAREGSERVFAPSPERLRSMFEKGREIS